ncbi:MAG: hypothetical protein AAGF85_16365, partial [Bacteroidota bacterium]
MERSNSYPAYTLNACVSFAQEIYNSLGKTDYASPELISDSVFKKAYTTLKQKFSSSVQYGLLDLKKRQGYRVTSLFISIAHPINQGEDYRSRKEAIKCPPLYKKLIDKYDGQILPNAVGLESIFIRDYGISKSAAKKAVEVFFSNCSD